MLHPKIEKQHIIQYRGHFYCEKVWLLYEEREVREHFEKPSRDILLVATLSKSGKAERVRIRIVQINLTV